MAGLSFLSLVAATVVERSLQQTILNYLIVAAVLILPFVVGHFIAQGLRMPDYSGKLGLILWCVTVSTAAIWGGWPPALGVDLKGGVILVFQVDKEYQSGDATTPDGQPSSKVDMNALAQALKMRVNPDGLKEIVIRPFGEDQIEVIIPEVDPDEIALIKEKIIKAGLLEFMITADRNDAAWDARQQEAAVAQASSPQKKLLRFVKDSDGKSIAKWVRIARSPVDKKTDVRVFKVKQAAASGFLRDGKTGDLLNDPAILTAARQDMAAEAQGSTSYALEKYIDEKGIELEVLMRVDDNDVKGADLDYARKASGAGGYKIEFGLKGEGVVNMGSLTQANLGRQVERHLGIVLDNELLSAPVIRDRISDQGQITGNFSEQEVDFVISILKAGQLPAVLQKTPISENLISPTLGSDTIQKGAVATGVSFLCVIIFMLIYYRFAGLVADIALILNFAMTLAIMMLIRAPLTLPGLAGLVLTAGMAVDANVLIFERIREELAKGSGLRTALRNGFDKAMVTIIDSNLTTLLTAVVLYVIGTDQVRGFATTLILGIVTSMYTACYVARTIFDIGERTRMLTNLSFMKMFTTTHIKFTGMFKPAVIASVIFIVAGLVGTVARKQGLFDIDLAGGYSVTVVLNKPMNVDEVRSEIVDKIFADKQDQHGTAATYSVNGVTMQGREDDTVYKIDTSMDDKDKVEEWIREGFIRDGKSLLKTYEVSIADVKSVAIAAPQPPTETPPATPAVETPAPTPPAEEKKDEGEKKDDEKKADEKKEGCAQAEDDKPADDKPAEAKPEDKPAAEPKAEEKPAEKPADEPKAEEPKAGVAAVMTQATLKFAAPGMTGQAVRDRIERAASGLFKEEAAVVVSNPKWDGNSSARFEDWNVQVGLDEAKTKELLNDVSSVINTSPIFESSSKIGGQVAVDTQLKAVVAVLFSLLGIAVYVWVRFHKLSWGIAAVAALLHDTLVMLGAVALSYWLAKPLGFLGVEEFKISLTVIAAFLTLIGYSINDTIVIFDRIREIRGKNPNISAETIDVAVNQTLSRTILTAGTTFITVLVIYIGGGPGIHAFAFSMLIGVISGTYSTVFIAAPMLLWMMGGKENKKGGWSV